MVYATSGAAFSSGLTNTGNPSTRATIVLTSSFVLSTWNVVTLLGAATDAAGRIAAISWRMAAVLSAKACSRLIQGSYIGQTKCCPAQVL